MKARVGRPPERPAVTDETAVRLLCMKLASGLSMREACAENDVPSATAIYERLAFDAEFRSIIARAREAQADANVDEIVELADAATPENWQVIKLRMHARQWRAEKLNPKVYGNRVELAGEIGVKDLTDEHVESRVVDLLRTAGVAGALGGAGASAEAEEAPRLLPGDGASEA